ncbi:MAG: outer membrane beta-barrel protein [Bacteroidetes bacterium]|uniref:Outer membrane beta-barrel protein n=1 Tax=Candidatus Cryptobacteroides merdavium TaxID=2840769 RepID=A0A9D9EAE1_9BACT|nr:outer membrane beta-barrel protein [Candidatus Cryptobacteroides merdavium]
MKLLVSLAVAFLCADVYAQVGFPVKMKLSDKVTGEPVGFATVSMTLKGAKEPLKYIMSTETGEAVFEGIVRGTYILKAELMGYKPYEQELTVDRLIDLGEVKLLPDVEVLEAAKVEAVGNPIIVKKDTIEYSASSFKTSDNDMLEELLKKLPGVEIGSDGSITANGETITKVMIDGKEFFLDDPQLATKNIPAKIIEKVRVVEKKSEQAEFTGIDDGDEETVIDLSVKPGMMDGWFGNVMAGGGHDMLQKNTGDAGDWRYQAAGMAGRFTNNSQISIILNGNNTNNRGFNDIAGSMMQTMRGSRGMGRGTGGWGRNGITTSWMAGANGAFNLLDNNMELNGNYMYGGSQRYVEEQSSRTTYMDDGSVLIYDNDGYNTSTSDGHRFGVRLDHKFSENTSILFEPQFNFGNGSYTEYSDFLTLSESNSIRDTTNRGFNENTGINRNWTANGFLLFRQRLGKPGRTVSVMFNYNFSNNDLWGFNQSLTRTFENDAAVDDIVNQRYDQNSKSTSMTGRVVYTEPLGHDFYVEANYSYSWNRSTSIKDAYNSGGNASDLIDSDGRHMTYDPSGETYDGTYSSNILNRYINQSAGLNFMYQKDKLRAQLGAAIRPTDTHNETNGENYDSKVINWSPQAMFGYDIDDNTNIRMFYFGRSSQPSTSQLMPVPDNSDPLNVSLGNPYLIPYFSHNIRSMFGYTDKNTFMSIHGRFGGSIVQDPIVNAQWYDSNGAQYSIPVNGPTSGSVDGRVMINSPFGKNSKFSIFSMTYARYNESASYIGKTDGFNTEDYYDSETAEFNYDLFHKHFDERRDEMFTENRTQSLNFTQRLRFTFRNDFLELNVGGRMRISKSWYTIASYSQNATWNNQIDASMNWTIPGGVSLIADCDYNWYRGYTTPQDDEFVFNAEINKLLFKDKFTLAVKAYDIFNQSKNLSVTDESNYHLETRNNTLGRYIMVSLTYRFGNFGQAGGGHRGPGGPMGPPHRR